MKSFSIISEPALKFTSTLATTCFVSTAMNYKKLSFMYLSMKYRTCPTLEPYFFPDTNLCYDICPDGTFSNSALYLC